MLHTHTLQAPVPFGTKVPASAEDEINQLQSELRLLMLKHLKEKDVNAIDEAATATFDRSIGVLERVLDKVFSPLIGGMGLMAPMPSNGQQGSKW